MALMASSSLSNTGYASDHYTPMITGFLGLNTTPSARMQQAGTIRTGTAYLDPYIHGFIGAQLTDQLFVSIRQTAETSNILKSSDRLYPGVDLKLRLTEENAHTPQIAIGLQSALGHKRQSGEFIAASKRYNNFDFTAGLGWGRYGTAGHLDNPLKIFGSHFDKQRDFQSENSNTPSHWFTGDKIGIFGGIEYFLPVKGLSLKLDYGSDHYSAEEQNNTYDPPSPWGLGITYAPNRWVNAGFGIQGKDKITARLSLKSSPKNWKYNQIHNLSLKNSSNSREPKKIVNFDKAYIQENTLFITLSTQENISTPEIIKHTMLHIEEEFKHSHEDIKEYAFILRNNGLNGKTIRVSRQQLLKAYEGHEGSPQEAWLTAKITSSPPKTNAENPFLMPKGINIRSMITAELQNYLSLSEEDKGILYRSSLLLGVKKIPLMGTINGANIKLNLADNLNSTNRRTTLFKNPARSNLADFSDNVLTLENAYIGFAKTPKPNLNMMFLAGYLEEQYAAIGGEVLYRPLKSKWALGAEIWQTRKRNPENILATGLTNQSSATGFANIWYDFTRYNVTANAKIGQFLAGDKGFELGLKRKFQNGSSLKAAIRYSNTAEPDIFGKNNHAYHSINLSLPLGYIPELNTAPKISTNIEPLLRDTAQTLKKPLNLYDMTEKFTIDHMSKNWHRISQER